MAKKNKSKKKHNFKQSQSASVVAKSTTTEPQKAEISSKPQVESTSAATLVPHLPLVMKDVRNVIILAASFVAIEIVLWYLFGHTSLGPAVYRLIKI